MHSSLLRTESVRKIGSSNSHEEIVRFAVEKGISLAVIGPEQPLVDGLTDALRDAGVLCFGPSQCAARLEASKAWYRVAISTTPYSLP